MFPPEHVCLREWEPSVLDRCSLQSVLATRDVLGRQSACTSRRPRPARRPGYYRRRSVGEEREGRAAAASGFLQGDPSSPSGPPPVLRFRFGHRGLQSGNFGEGVTNRSFLSRLRLFRREQRRYRLWPAIPGLRFKFRSGHREGHGGEDDTSATATIPTPRLRLPLIPDPPSHPLEVRDASARRSRTALPHGAKPAAASTEAITARKGAIGPLTPRHGVHLLKRSTARRLDEISIDRVGDQGACRPGVVDPVQQNDKRKEQSEPPPGRSLHCSDCHQRDYEAGTWRGAGPPQPYPIDLRKKCRLFPHKQDARGRSPSSWASFTACSCSRGDQGKVLLVDLWSDLANLPLVQLSLKPLRRASIVLPARRGLGRARATGIWVSRKLESVWDTAPTRYATKLTAIATPILPTRCPRSYTAPARLSSASSIGPVQRSATPRTATDIRRRGEL